MKNYKWLILRDTLRASYWFIPTLMTGAAIVLAFITLALDHAEVPGLLQLLGLGHYYGGPSGALTLLSAIASSMITVAATVFSVTLVALTLAAQQFGLRVLLNFMQNVKYKVVLGTFLSTFLYCLLILRSIHAGEANPFVPQFSITVAILLTIASVCVLIYFIYYASTSIHAWHIIREISDELEENTSSLFSEKFGDQLSIQSQESMYKNSKEFKQEAYPISATSSGYIRSIDYSSLMAIAKSKNLLLHTQKRPRKFIVQGSVLVKAYSKDDINDKLVKQINKAFILGQERTAFQDVEFSIRQLVEIAIRAIFPAVNDPFTALRCIDQLTAALCRLAQGNFPTSHSYDNTNTLRLIVNHVSFDGLVNDAFHQIRQYGRTDVAITIRLLESITMIAEHTQNDTDRLTLLRHADMVKCGSQDGILEALDRKDVDLVYQAAAEAIGKQK